MICWRFAAGADREKAIRCGRCEHENREDARFCDACGASLEASCSGCGRLLRPGARFCDGCGAAVTAAAPAEGDPPSRQPLSYTPAHLAERILRQRSALEGERKIVTVLFADAVGFTSIGERVDPEDLHAWMERCVQALLAEVHHFEGVVNQFTGDGVMALFGAPLALEDAPRRAVMAGLAMQSAIQPLAREIHATRGIEFRMRIGIHTGPVVVGRIGNDLRMDYTAIGDTTNLAARLQAAAAPGSVLVSEATHRLVEGLFEERSVGPLELKGKSQPVAAFEMLSERRGRRRIDVLADRGLTAFTGREHELAALTDAFESARRGSGQVVFLAGDAGIGKSRLLYEFRSSLAGAPHVWIEGRCASYGSATAFLPIVDALRRWFGIDDRDDEAAAVAKVDAAVLALGADLAWALPFVRLLLSLPAGDEAAAALDAASRRSQTFGALKALALRAAATDPLVLAIEDLHWIDRASEEYLAFLADVVPGMRALLVCSHRPGYRQPFGDRSYHARVALRPLSDAEMARMTRSLLDSREVPPAVCELVARKAEGNALFVEEVAKSLLEQGVLHREGEAFVLDRAPEAIAVPDTIHDLLMARIDRLGEEPKRAIQVASVIGREFALRLLARITEAGESLPHQVEELRALELIYEKAAHPELAYMFKHALTHDAAYRSILRERRKGLHRTIGLAIEALYADRLAEHYETLAHHFEHGEDWDRALDYHERAAAKAAAGYASATVAEHCRSALAIADRLGAAVTADRRRALEERLALACLYLSEYRASAEAFVRAAGQSADPLARALNLGQAGHSYVWAHDFDRTQEVASEALSIARAGDAAPGEAIALTAEAFRQVVAFGAIDAFEALSREALARARATGDEIGATVAGVFLLDAAEWTGDFKRALEIGEPLVPIARRLGLAHMLFWSSWFVGKAACCLGDYGRALSHLEQARETTERIGDRAWRSRILNTLGWCYGEIGSYARAMEHNRLAAELAREFGDDEIIANAEINLAFDHMALGETARAGELLARLRERVARASPFMRWRYSLHLEHALGREALARGAPDRALACAREELAGAVRFRARKLEARARLLEGEALLAMDERESARGALREAVRVAESIGHPRGAWRPLRRLSELARRAGAAEEAAQIEARAEGIADALARSLEEHPELRACLRAAR